MQTVSGLLRNSFCTKKGLQTVRHFLCFLKGQISNNFEFFLDIKIFRTIRGKKHFKFFFQNFIYKPIKKFGSIVVGSNLVPFIWWFSWSVNLSLRPLFYILYHWSQFYQHFTLSFYILRSQKRKKMLI